MSYAEFILPEFDEEMANTRKVLERVPDDKLDWKAHPKSQTIGWNANHLAEIPGWIPGTFAGTSWDFSPPGEEPYQTPSLATRAEILKSFDENVAAARAALELAKEEEIDVPWTLLYQGNALFTMPRRNVVRSFVLNHSIHHRAVLLVYLRLNHIPIPGMYGPSGDES
jgi:uncharacterized damage-inducible protein DinB